MAVKQAEKADLGQKSGEKGPYKWVIAEQEGNKCTKKISFAQVARGRIRQTSGSELSKDAQLVSIFSYGVRHF